MDSTDTHGLSRRSFLAATGSTGLGLLLGFSLPDPTRAAARKPAEDFVPNAFLRIAPDDTVTVIAKHLEMGQGCFTGLATVVCEELGASWAQVRVEAAPADVSRYANLAWGIQGTGGSSALANSWDQLRKAGATARAALVGAAAELWKVPVGRISVAGGVVRHADSGRSVRFGELAERAAARPVPADAPLKDPQEFHLIGRRAPRVDSRSKARGEARFGFDHDLPGTLTAVLARPPRFGATLKSFDASAAKAVPGVVEVHATPRGVAVLAEGFWPARLGRDRLRIEWDHAGSETRGTEAIRSEYREHLAKPGLPARVQGDAGKALARAKVVLEAEYELPYLAHAPMEPLSAVIRIGKDGVDYWAGCQLQTIDQQTVAAVLGIGPEKVRIHTLFAGGSFGRRATPDGELAGEVAALAKAVGGTRPIKVVWTREDDLAGGRYRPLTVHRLRVGIDSKGGISGWTHGLASQSVLAGTPFAGMIKDGIDYTSVEGASDVPYRVADQRVELHPMETGVPVLWWRSVGHSSNAFVIETMLDEVATAAHVDPVELRLSLLPPDARERAVLRLAAERAGWGRQLPPGRARGIAVHKSFGSYVAQVAEVSVGEDGLPRVHRVVCAVDCGIAVNPDNIEAQMQSGIGFGLGAALLGEIELEKGRPVARNFQDYRQLRIDRMPEVEVHIVPSTFPPTGVGEPGVPPIAPAVANAWFQLTGRRVRRLPFSRGAV